MPPASIVISVLPLTAALIGFLRLTPVLRSLSVLLGPWRLLLLMLLLLRLPLLNLLLLLMLPLVILLLLLLLPQVILLFLLLLPLVILLLLLMLPLVILLLLLRPLIITLLVIVLLDRLFSRLVSVTLVAQLMLLLHLAGIAVA